MKTNYFALFLLTVIFFNTCSILYKLEKEESIDNSWKLQTEYTSVNTCRMFLNESWEIQSQEWDNCFDYNKNLNKIQYFDENNNERNIECYSHENEKHEHFFKCKILK